MGREGAEEIDGEGREGGEGGTGVGGTGGGSCDVISSMSTAASLKRDDPIGFKTFVLISSAIDFASKSFIPKRSFNF